MSKKVSLVSIRADALLDQQRADALLDQQVYVYAGDGLGVPGLAHEMTQAQADADGVGDVLQACIAQGVYVKKAAEQAGKV